MQQGYNTRAHQPRNQTYSTAAAVLQNSLYLNQPTNPPTYQPTNNPLKAWKGVERIDQGNNLAESHRFFGQVQEGLCSFEERANAVSPEASRLTSALERSQGWQVRDVERDDVSDCAFGLSCWCWSPSPSDEIFAESMFGYLLRLETRGGGGTGERKFRVKTIYSSTTIRTLIVALT